MLKVAILSSSSGAYSTRRLREACLRRGHEVSVLHTLRFSLLVERGKPALFFRNKPLARYDAVIPRIGASISGFGTAVVRQFEQLGVFTLNPADAILRARDKLCSVQILSRHGVSVPATAFARDRSSVPPAIAAVGGVPVMIKLLEGSQGIGVMLAETHKVAEAIVEALHSTRQHVVIQRFVAHSRGRDLRALVVGERVVAAVARRAADGEFRANVHRGGRSEAIQLEPAFERAAIRATRILGLRVAGVDMLEGPEGPELLEVNSSPGLEGVEAATGVDVAGAIVEHLEEQAPFPAVDLVSRLSLNDGFGVVEHRVAAGSAAVGKTLSELGLVEREVRVLSIIRGGEAIPNPHADERLALGDLLLCFGRHLTLRRLLPVAVREVER